MNFKNTKYQVEYQTLNAFIKNATSTKALTAKEICTRVKVFPCFKDESDVFIKNRFNFLREKNVCCYFRSKKIHHKWTNLYLHRDHINL